MTQDGRRLALQSLRSIWPQVFAIYLDDEQLAFLRQATALSEERQAGYARVEWVPWRKVFDALGWRTSDNAPAYDITARLKEEGCLERMAALGARLPHIAIVYEQSVLARRLDQVGDRQVVGAGRFGSGRSARSRS